MDHGHVASDALQEYGYRCTPYNHRTFSTWFPSQIAGDIKTHKYNLVWIGTPILGLHIHPNKFEKLIKDISDLTRIALKNKIPTILFGGSGKIWDHPYLYPFTQEVEFDIREHRLCHFGVKVNILADKPSSAAFRSVAHGVRLQDHPCNCPAGTEHVHDWNFQPQDKPRHM